MLGSETVSALSGALAVANSICESLDTPFPEISTSRAQEIPLDLHAYRLPSPQPLLQQLSRAGISAFTASKINDAYLRTAEGLKVKSEGILRESWSKLFSVQQHPDVMPAINLCKQMFEFQRKTYLSTLAQWEEQAIKLANSQIGSHGASSAEAQSSVQPKKPKRQFKSEFLPLFEFAFEKDRFPSREDKKHLARISSMSYRQVSVWFQNRRCRTGKHRRTTPMPQTLDEVKERLAGSAKEAFSASNPSSLRLFCRAQEAVEYAQVIPTMVEQKVFTSEEPEEPYDSDADDDTMMLNDHDHGDVDPILPESPPTPPIESNPLNMPTSTIVPAVYKPAQLRFDPFVVEHTPWMRQPVGYQSRRTIDSSSSSFEHVLEAFRDMDVLKTSLQPLSPRAPKATLSLSPRMPTIAFGRTAWRLSSGSSDTAESSSSPSSRSSSYSTMSSSSTLSTPQNSETDLPPMDDSVYSPRREPSPDSSEADTLFESIPYERAAKGNQDESEWGVGDNETLNDAAGSNKWEQLLAAVTAAS
ncbi:hypothetical protein M422DRAFT_37807 [Sphaerobolus stellatus SS14]|uniref:Homeobox domain-containing protein n=1 Tax=Sphaerobolus stellatus (strain SS14) TaxID=990650 RepID=A0A0C9UPX2_SPHS4|nr:hypothetical protein M422DRAFT_271934 [Sphaerobolus stellatus SS14]KIJ27400.1 hypothetical protein M422DRAFT_37807 [Sphaerobolus stellatus SS14]